MYSKKFTAKDGTEVLFREPKAGEAKKYLDYINELADEPKNGIMVTEKKTLKDEKAWLVKTLAQIKANKNIVIAVEHNKKIVGMCNVTQAKHEKCSHVADLGISLKKEFREKGIGTALMEEAIELAKKRMKDLKIIELGLWNYNNRAKRVYEKNRFKQVARIPKICREDDGKYYDKIVMHLYV